MTYRLILFAATLLGLVLMGGCAPLPVPEGNETFHTCAVTAKEVESALAADWPTEEDKGKYRAYVAQFPRVDECYAQQWQMPAAVAPIRSGR
ncbi:MAG TPA: hypothetical protein VFY12_04905, partial [Arenimonas sp.]|nr:hypothetical protein [Arenimonas sp.]